MSVSHIRVEYDELEELAKHFHARADDFQKVQRRITRQFEILQAEAWQGNNANRFFMEMDNEILPAFQRLHKALSAAGETITTLIQVYEEAEETAASNFRLSSDADGGLNGASPESKQVIFVNGIQTSAEDHRQALWDLERILGKPVMGIYNKTEGISTGVGKQAYEEWAARNQSLGNLILNHIRQPLPSVVDDFVMLGKVLADNKGLIQDGYQAINDMFENKMGGRLDGGNAAVDELVNQIKNHKGNLELVGHSQGGAIISAALNRLAEDNFDMSHITVTTLGGAGFDFPQGTNAPQYDHIVHDDDKVPFLNSKFNEINPYDGPSDEFLEDHELSGYLKTLDAKYNPTP